MHPADLELLIKDLLEVMLNKIQTLVAEAEGQVKRNAFHPGGNGGDGLASQSMDPVPSVVAVVVAVMRQVQVIQQDEVVMVVKKRRKSEPVQLPTLAAVEEDAPLLMELAVKVDLVLLLLLIKLHHSFL